MMLTGEQKIGVVLLCVGIIVSASLQIEIAKYTRTLFWQNYGEVTVVNCPAILIRTQMVGLIISTVGATALIRPFVLESERMKYDREKDKLRE